MFKFLRKYNKWILAVGGVLLMIVFLIPQAITSLSQRAAVGSAVWATIGEDAEEVPAEARRQCERELAALERLQRAGIPLGITDVPEHWFLLVREADQAGLVGGRAADQVPPEQMDVLFSVAGRNADTDAAVSKSLAIGRMIQMYQSAAQLSDARLRAEAERLFHAVSGRAMVLEAAARPDAPEPTEAEIAAQFEAFRDVVPGNPDPEAGNPAGVGYRLPDRFQLEWMTIDTDAVRTLVEASGVIDRIALLKHWQRHAASRGFPPDAGAEIPDAVRTDLLEELVTAKRDEIERYASDRLLASRRRLKAEEAYFALPDDWERQRVDFVALARDVQEEFPGLALPRYRAIGDRWLTREDVAELDDLGRATTPKYDPGSNDAATLIAATREFGGDLRILVQEGVAGPALATAADESLVFFRITATDPARPARTVDEVREQVVEDLKRQADYERLVARADELEAMARGEGLLAVAAAEDADLRPLNGVGLYNTSILDFQMQNNLRLAASPGSLPVVGQDVPTIERIIDHALALPREAPLSELPAEQRTFVVPVASKQALMVVELSDQTPLDQERFTRMTADAALQAMLLNDELAEVDPPASDVFTFEALKARHRFEVTRRGDADDAEDAEDAPTTAPDAAKASAG